MAPPPNGIALEAPLDEDKRLVLAFKAGDSDSYDLIYERHSELVRRITRRMLINRQDSDEAFQETFLKVYTALGRFNGRYQLGAWIARIATNVCLDQLRAKKRHPVDSVEPEYLDVDMDPDTDLDPEFQLIRRQESKRVRRVLDQLPPMHRAAIVLRDFEGLSYAEIAKALDLNECQTKALIHRAWKGFKRTWPSAVAGVLIPTRWFSKLRRVRGAEEEIVRSSKFMSDAVASAGHFASSCATVVQQCGHAAAERFAATATTMVVGAAALGAPAAASSATPPPEPPPALVAAVEQADVVKGTKVERRAPMEVVKPVDQVAEPVAEPTEAPAPEPVEEEPAPPAPEPTEPPAGEGHDGGDGTDPDKPDSPPPPPPFTAAVGFAPEGGTTSSAVPTARSEEVNCDSRRMWQTLDIPVSGKGETYAGHAAPERWVEHRLVESRSTFGERGGALLIVGRTTSGELGRRRYDRRGAHDRRVRTAIRERPRFCQPSRGGTLLCAVNTRLRRATCDSTKRHVSRGTIDVESTQGGGIVRRATRRVVNSVQSKQLLAR